MALYNVRNNSKRNIIVHGKTIPVNGVIRDLTKKQISKIMDDYGQDAVIILTPNKVNKPPQVYVNPLPLNEPPEPVTEQLLKEESERLSNATKYFLTGRFEGGRDGTIVDITAKGNLVVATYEEADVIISGLNPSAKIKEWAEQNPDVIWMTQEDYHR